MSQISSPAWPVRLLQFVRFSHTIFALPFALGSMLVAANGLPSWRLILLILAAMVTARTAAMAFNRVADWEIDKRNPRTAGRHRLVSRSAAISLIVISSLLFIVVCWWINALCFALSPVALGIVFFYSFTKRVTRFTQLFLGLALSVSPVGAWLAVTGAFAAPPMWLAAAVLVWVAGFDLIYATQDVEIDRREGLRSMVTWLGVPRALVVARVFHLLALAGLAIFGWSASLGMPYWLAVLGILAALIYEHHQAARNDDLGTINRAFFNSNAVVGLLFVLGTGGSVLFG